MKRIINGLTYNIETSKLLGRSEWHRDDDSFENAEIDFEEELFQTKGGAFFKVIWETKRFWNESERENKERIRVNFVPMSRDQAQKWMLEGDTEVLDNPFGDPPEATAENTAAVQ
ncbi:MAG: hypothetical protein U1E81_12410 [Xanthobacteraceae bacterium]